MRTKTLHLKTCTLATTLLVALVSHAQQPMLKGYNYSPPESAIEFASDSLKLRMKNVCYYAPIFGVADTSNSNVLLMDEFISVIDTVPAKTITGIAGSIGNGSHILFSGQDSVYLYEYEDLDFDLVSRSSTYVQSDKITITRAPFDFNEWMSWLLLEKQDTTMLISWEDDPDTVLLELSNVVRIFYNLTDQKYIHITGNDENDSLRYYRFNLQSGNITHQYYIDTLPGELLHVSGIYDTFSYFITYDSSVLNATTHLFDSDTLFTQVVDTIDSIAVISNWNSGYNPKIAAIKHIGNDSSRIYTYNVLNWSKRDTFSSSFYINNVLFGKVYGRAQVRGMVYTDDAGLIYLTYPNVNQSNSTVTPSSTFLNIPSEMVAMNVSFYCWTGIDEIELPPIKTFVYSNPSSDRFNVIIKNVPCEKEHHLELLNMHGQVLYQTPFYSKCDITVPAHDLAPGMYLLKLHIDGQVHTRKVIKAAP